MKIMYTGLPSYVSEWLLNVMPRSATWRGGGRNRAMPAYASGLAEVRSSELWDEPTTAAIERLAIEALKIGRENPAAQRVFVNQNPYAAESYEVWLGSVTITAAAPEQGGVGAWQSMPTPAVHKDDVIPFLTERFPHLTFSGYRCPWGSSEVKIGVNEEMLSVGDRRFLADASDLRTRYRTVGSEYSGNFVYLDENDTLVEESEDEMVNMDRYVLDTLMTPEFIRENLQAARRTYRDRVFAGMRRADAEAERAREQALEAHRQKSASNFTKHREKQERELIRNSFGQRMFISELPSMPTGTKASRRWGIEIETGAGRDLRDTPAGWESKGDGSLESAYSDSNSYVWRAPDECYYSDRHDIDANTTTIERENPDTGETQEVEAIDSDYMNPADCSECGWVERNYDYDDYDDDDCVELVSPILTSAHSRGLKRICEDLEFAPRTDTAGVHVHVDAPDLTVRQIRDLVMGYDHIEPLLEASYDRVERGYCKRRSPQELLSIARQARTTNDISALRKGDRYVTVNLHSLDYHGTVEFRAMGPKYNYDHLTRWAMFCREMVNCVSNGAKSKDFAKVKTWDDVLALFLRFGVEYKQATGVSELSALTAREDELATV